MRVCVNVCVCVCVFSQDVGACVVYRGQSGCEFYPNDVGGVCVSKPSNQFFSRRPSLKASEMSSKRGGSERRGDSRRGSSPTREEGRAAGKNDGRQVLLDGDAAEAGRMEVLRAFCFLLDNYIELRIIRSFDLNNTELSQLICHLFCHLCH
jgi:hypothetical protein